MKQNIDSLFEFINAAEKSRKYAPNSAAGLRTALRLFQKELNEEEKSSTSLFRQNLNQIYQQVVNKNISSYNASSLDVYRKRILRLLNDYEKYGIDPTKLSSWSPKIRLVIRDATKSKKQLLGQKVINQEQKEHEGQNPNVPMTRFELQLRPGVTSIIQTPHDMTFDEAKKIRSYIGYLMVTIDPTYKPGQ